MSLRIYLFLILFFSSFSVFAYSAAGARAAAGRVATEAAQNAGGSLQDSAMRSLADQTAQAADKQAAADQAAADVAKQAAADAAASATPNPEHPVKEVYCCGPYGYNTAACAYRYNVLHDGSCGVQIDPAYIAPSSSADAQAAQVAADAAQATATAHKAAADTLNGVADFLLGRNISAGRSANGAQKPSGVNLAKDTNPSANRDYLAKDNPNPKLRPNDPVTTPPRDPNDPVTTPPRDPTAPPSGRGTNPYPNMTPDSGCVEGDTRVQCQVPDYKKTVPSNPTGSTPTTTPTDTGTGCGCCDASDPAYGGSAKQVEAMRGEAAKEAAKAKDALANVALFNNNKRVGFDNGIIDGDYQAKHNLCGDASCYLTYCDKNIGDVGCLQYQDFDTRVKKISDSEVNPSKKTISETAPSCPVFQLDAGLLGVHAVNEHCLIVDKMRPSIDLMMAFLSLFVAFKVVVSA